MVKPRALMVEPPEVMINPGQVMLKPAHLTVVATNRVVSRLCLDDFGPHHDLLADEVMVSGHGRNVAGFEVMSF